MPDAVTLPTFASFRRSILALSSGELTEAELLTDEFLIGREGKLSVFYAPLHSVETRARIALVGLTPGFAQMHLAYEACRDALVSGKSDDEAWRSASGNASFSGMRARIAAWLDDLGVAAWLGVETTAALFDSRRELLHATSAIRFPVFVGSSYDNYTGHGPRPEKSSLLMEIVGKQLVPELLQLPDALIVPMGTAVAGVLAELPDVVDPARCLFGFPHPSGANGWANRHFAAARTEMSEKVVALAR